MQRLLFILFFLFAFTSIDAQTLSNWRENAYEYTGDTLVLDSLSLVPGTLILTDEKGLVIDTSFYDFDDVNALIVWKNAPSTTTIYARYRVFPYKFSRPLFHKDYLSYQEQRDENGFIINTTNPNSISSSGSLVDFGRLDYNGNLSRGVSFGNAQSLNLNSSFNLQLSGMLTRDIEIKAAITDNNIPIQPEGNTAQIQEFDKVFVQLRMQEHYLTIGDFDLKNPSTYFMRFQRNLQGVSYRGTQSFDDVGTVNAMGSFAVSRGKFVVNNPTAQEGNQGPYKLAGPNGETFIIVIAGSERVFINGEQLQRGANHDYTIDYNLGEITFTPNRMITQDMRIRIEFEYADRYYFRSQYHVNGEFEHEKMAVRVNYFSEQDAKNQPVNQDLNDERKLFLTNLGDDISNAFATGITPATFDESRVLYTKKDTVQNGVVDTIFIYTTNANDDLYTLNFSFVGQNEGNYEPASSVANGRVFEWISPLPDGTPQGSYEPVVKLIAPSKSQLLTTALDYKITENTLLSGEFALSNRDVNTFSAIDDEDDKGLAAHLHFEDVRNFANDSLKAVLLAANYEFKQAKFIPLERYRTVEFTRDWNLSAENLNDEHLGNISAQFLHKEKGSVDYQFSFLTSDTLYKGFQHTIQSQYEYNGWKSTTNLKWLQSKATAQSSNFLRPNAQISKAIAALKGWEIGVATEHEINKIKYQNTDSLLNTSFRWHEYQAFIASPDSLRNQYQFSYKLRYQHLPDEEKFDEAYLRAHTFDLKGRFLAKKNHTLNWKLTYRNLQQDTLFTNNDDLKHFYLGRIDYNFVVKKGAIKGNTLYEIGAGREQKTQYNYIESPDGQGSYAWQDINENGVQELNEFYVSAFSNENRYLRIFSNSLEFQPVNSTRFNQSISLNPKAVWFNKEGIKGFIARFSSTTAVQLSKKVFADSDVKIGQVISPIAFGLEDTLLVSKGTSVRQVVFFNRTDTKYGLEYNFNHNENKTLLTSGFEKRLLTSHAFKLRWNFIKTMTFNAKYTNGFKQNDSDFFFDRKYEYIFNETETNITWLYDSKLRLGLTHKYAFRSNPLPVTGGQFAVSNEATVEMKYSRASKSTLTARFSFANVGYNDDSFQNEQLAFDMLQGLQDGNNYIWGATLDRTIAKNLQLSMSYEARKTGETAIVHTGRAQVRAIF
ncbi:MAG: hypothetical protein ACPG4Z_00210 [Chitinophagales bacterium]